MEFETPSSLAKTETPPPGLAREMAFVAFDGEVALLLEHEDRRGAAGRRAIGCDEAEHVGRPQGLRSV